MYQKVIPAQVSKSNPLGVDSKKYSPSQFKPTQKEKTVTKLVQDDMTIGRNILTKPYTWFNGRNILQERDENQKRFNSYIPPKSNDPDESWRANTVRPLTRNKLISIAAHVTAKILYPNIFAQNERDEEDRAAAEVMKDTIEWAIDNSEYATKFVGAVLGALTDPVAVLEVGFSKVLRSVKEKQKDGSYKTQEIVDELLSGFVQNYRQCNEVYITNVFENNIQKQRAVSIRTLIDYEEAKLLYGKHKNFKYVQNGVRTIFDPITQSFFDTTDADLEDNSVERVVYRNRYKDLELVFINGILVSNPDECIARQDKRYGLASFGYEYINNGNFFYYKSAVNKLTPDQDVIDTMYNMVMDGTFLAVMPPMALFGNEEITSQITVPGTITSFKDPNTKLENVGPKSDLNAGMNAISLLEKSMSESSHDQFQMGIMTPGERTAQEIQTLQQNARTALGLFGKMIQNFVKQIGILMVGDVLQYITVAELSQISTEGLSMRYKTILLDGKIVNGKNVTKKIRFTDKGMINKNPTHDDIMNHSMDLLEEENKYDGNMVIYDINPEVFRKIKFLVRINPDDWKDKSEDLEKALNLEAYDRLIQNPVIAQDIESMKNVTKTFLIEQYVPGEAEKFMPKENAMPTMNGNMGEMAAEGVGANQTNQFNQKGVNNNLTSQITGASSIKKLIK